MYVQSKPSGQKQLTNIIFIRTFYLFAYYVSTYLKKDLANKIENFKQHSDRV